MAYLPAVHLILLLNKMDTSYTSVMEHVLMIQSVLLLHGLKPMFVEFFTPFATKFVESVERILNLIYTHHHVPPEHTEIIVLNVHLDITVLQMGYVSRCHVQMVRIVLQGRLKLDCAQKVHIVKIMLKLCVNQVPIARLMD